MKGLMLTGFGKAAVAAVAVATVWVLYAATSFVVDESALAAPASDPSLQLPPVAAPAARAISVSATVDANPFSQTRSRPGQRYLLPGEVDPDEIRAQRATSPIRVLGTVLAGDSTASFVMAQLGTAQAMVVRLGGTIGDYTLRAVRASSASFVSSTGERIEVRAEAPAVAGNAVQAGPPPPAPGDLPAGRGGRGGGAGGGGRGGAAGGRGGR